MKAAQISNKAERQYAEMLDWVGVKWERPRAKTFSVGNTSYTPDFFLPETNTYVEVIGTRQRWLQLRDKLTIVRDMYPDIPLSVVDSAGLPYVDKNPSGGRRKSVEDVTVCHLIRDIPPDLWLAVKIRAAERNETIRAALLRMLATYSRRKAQE